MEVTFSEVLTSLGTEVETTRKTTDDEAAVGQAEADLRARTRIRQWLEELNGGPLASPLFCKALIDGLGWRAEAMALRSAVEAELDRPGVTLPLNAIVGFYSLALDAEEAGNFEACEYWAGRGLAIWEK